MLGTKIKQSSHQENFYHQKAFCGKETLQGISPPVFRVWNSFGVSSVSYGY